MSIRFLEKYSKNTAYFLIIMIGFSMGSATCAFLLITIFDDKYYVSKSNNTSQNDIYVSKYNIYDFNEIKINNII